jgi:hypothetical protein
MKMTNHQSLRDLIANTIRVPDHLDIDTLISEATTYSEEYKVDIETALRDVADEYFQGEAEADDALRNGDWDYGRE